MPWRFKEGPKRHVNSLDASETKGKKRFELPYKSYIKLGPYSQVKSFFFSKFLNAFDLHGMWMNTKSFQIFILQF